MSMSKKNQGYVLGGLAAVLAFVFYLNHNSGPSFAGVVADERYEPLKVEDPSLRLDLLDRIRNTEYSGTHRNIFTGEAPPPPPSVVKKMQEEEAKKRALPPPILSLDVSAAPAGFGALGNPVPSPAPPSTE